jgi:hypothetical protein
LGGLDGVSLASILPGDGAAAGSRAGLEARPVFAHRMRWGRPEMILWSAIRGTWKLIRNPDGSPELYDHQRDPGERRNLAGSRVDLTGELGAKIDEIARRRPPRPSETREVELDPSKVEALEKLGYIKD